MRESRLSTEAGQQYALAYEAQYKTKEIQKAFALYEHIITAQPDTQEAGYSRSQIQNIVNAVVPKKTVMDSLIKLARIHLGQDVPLEAELAPA
jgi:hypothetical protein